MYYCSNNRGLGSMKRKHSPKKAPHVPSTHPFIGTWVQTENPFHRTTVVFTVTVKAGHFLVRGVEEEDHTTFKISRVKWDGECLRFVSLFPPTNHKAEHVFRLIGRGRINHNVTYTDEEGTYTDDERWEKRSRG
jgi:hypothetical protein